jgi:hypothetical protein
MEVKKHFSFSRGISIWRLLLNEQGHLLIEERDTEKHEVFFQCFDIQTGKQLIKNLALEEKFWVGIDGFEGDTIFFHGYIKPDMPWHKGITAYSVSAKKVIWKNPEITYSFLHEGKIYSSRQLFESAEYYTVDPSTGSIIEELGNDAENFKLLKEAFYNSRDYSNYRFPSFYTSGIYDDLFVKKLHLQDNYLKEVEIIEYFNSVIFTDREDDGRGKTNQKLNVVDIESQKVIFSDVINKNEENRTFDSFFVYCNLLIVVRNKIGVAVYRLA